MSIQGFRSKALQRFFDNRDARKLPAQHVERIAWLLEILDAPDALRVLRKRQTWRLHRLAGDRKRVWSVRVSACLRLTFRYDGRDTYDIDLSHHYGD